MKKTYSCESITPVRASEQDDLVEGLSKREFFAAMAISGRAHSGFPSKVIAQHAVAIADSLIKALNEDRSEEEKDR